MICQYCGTKLFEGFCTNPACPGTLRREEMSEKKVHYLKTWPEPFRAVVAGIKRADFRLNDRDYHVGDTIVLEEFEPDNCGYTGKQHTVTITHIQDGFGIPDGYVMLSIDTPAPAEVERLVDDLLSVSKQLGQSEARGLYDHIEPAEVAINDLKSRLLAALSNTAPYLSRDVKGVYKYEIDSPDELDAGLHGFRDEVTVIVDSGEPGGDPTGEDSFEEYMRQALIEWYDGAGVTLKKEGD